MNPTAAVVVTYNRLTLLQRCVACLLAQSVPCDVLIVDNASSDGTESWAEEYCREHANVQYRNLGENLGGAGGFHHGMHRAVEAGYEYVWVMDDDCLPKPDALRELMNADQELGGCEKYGWLSSQCLWTDGTLCQMNLQRKTPYKDIAGFDRALVSAQMASFVSLFVPAVNIKKFGLPIKEFFIWTDDWEFTRRISREMPCYAVRDSQVVHAMKNATTVNIATDTPERLSRYRYFYRNDVYLYRREGLKGWMWVIAKDCWHSVQLLWHFGKYTQKKIGIVWKGFYEGVCFLNENDSNMMK